MQLGQISIGAIMAREVARVQKEQSLASAHEVMKQRGIRHLPVVHNGWLEGILSERDVLAVQRSAFERALSEDRDAEREMQIPVAKAMTARVFSATQDESALAVARLMLARRIACVPVTDHIGWLVGVVTSTDFTALVEDLFAHQPFPSAAEVMTANPQTGTSDDLVEDLLARMQSESIRHIPIVDSRSKPVGMVSHRDILAWQSSNLQQPERFDIQFRATEIMSTPVVTVERHAQISQVARLLNDKKIGCVVVTDGAKLCGVITNSDLLRLLVERFSGGAAVWNPVDVPVNYYMNAPIRTIEVTEGAAVASELLRSYRISCLLVTDHGKTVGILARSDLIGTIDADELVGAYMSHGVIEIDISTSLVNACRTMIEREVHQVVVRQHGSPVGVLSRSDAVAAVRDFRFEQTAASCASAITYTISANQPLVAAEEMLAHTDIGTLVVVDGRFVIGVYGPRERLNLAEADDDATVEQAMSSHFLTVPADLALHRAAAQMAAGGAELAVVMHNDRQVGVLTASDFTRTVASLAQAVTMTTPGGKV